MQKSYAIYLSVLLLLALFSAGIHMDWADLAQNPHRLSMVLVAGYVTLAHAPSLLPVAKQRSFFGPAPKWMTPPEIIHPPLIWGAWILIGFMLDQILVFMAAGLASALGITIGYIAVRTNMKIAGLLRQVAAPNPRYQTSKLAKPGARYAYLLRATATSTSLLGALWALTGSGSAALWLPLCTVMAGVAAATLVAVNAHSSRIQAQGAQRVAYTAIGQEEQVKGYAEVALYCSDKAGSKHSRIETINKALLAEGLNTAIIARETHSLARLGAFGATHLWSSPYLAGLDALARPNMRAAFYTHDGIKNGHFVRFNQISHILDAGTGAIANTEHLAKVLNMYDYIIAPNSSTAAVWRETAEGAWQGRILTLDTNSLQTLPADQPIERTANVAISVRYSGKRGLQITPQIFSNLKSVVSMYHAESQAFNSPETETVPMTTLGFCSASRLLISVARQSEDINATWQEDIVSLGNDPTVPLISHSVGPSSVVWDEADIIIVTSIEDVDHLRTTGKPLLWMGSEPAPDGTVPFNPQKGETPYEVAARAPRPEPPQFHFTSYLTLLEYTDKNRELQPDWSTT